jgi:DNA-binding transcriptional LysR family regulator
VVDRLTRQYPRMAFHVLADGVPAILEQELTQRRLELIVTRLHDPMAADQSAEILFYDTLVVATGAKHPLTRRRNVRLSEIASEPWLLPLNPMFGSVVVAAFHASGLEPPRLTVSTTSINLRNNLLASGRFMTVTPGFLLKLPRPHPFLRALSIDLPNARHPIAIVRLKNRVLSPLAQLFCDRARVLTRPLAKD